MREKHRFLSYFLVLGLVAAVAFVAGIFWSSQVRAEETPAGAKSPRVIYPKNVELDFEGMHIVGEVKNPGEFYFQRRGEEKFDSLVKRRKNFHREMLRDVVLSK
jgi:hypothetical protein